MWVWDFTLYLCMFFLLYKQGPPILDPLCAGSQTIEPQEFCSSHPQPSYALLWVVLWCLSGSRALNSDFDHSCECTYVTQQRPKRAMLHEQEGPFQYMAVCMVLFLGNQDNAIKRHILKWKMLLNRKKM